MVGYGDLVFFALDAQRISAGGMVDGHDLDVVRVPIFQDMKLLFARRDTI